MRVRSRRNPARPVIRLPNRRSKLKPDPPFMKKRSLTAEVRRPSAKVQRPRFSAPSHSSPSREEAPGARTPSLSQPIVLPGESLSRYGAKPAESAPRPEDARPRTGSLRQSLVLLTSHRHWSRLFRAGTAALSCPASRSPGIAASRPFRADGHRAPRRRADSGLEEHHAPEPAPIGHQAEARPEAVVEHTLPKPVDLVRRSRSITLQKRHTAM